MALQQPLQIVEQQPVEQNLRRKRVGKLLFFVLTLSSAFVLFFAGWSTTIATGRLQLTPTAVKTLPPLPGSVLPNGVAAGDIDQTSAVLWTRSQSPSVVTFTYGVNLTNTVTLTRFVSDPTLPVTVALSGLISDTQYLYRVFTPSTIGITGTFRTAAGLGVKTGLRFGVSGDWRGELAPYPAVSNAAKRDLDFFVALGDTIYADYPSPAVPLTQATTLAEFRQKHNEVYSVQSLLNTLADLRRSTALFTTIDDHEVTNNFAGGANAATDPRFGETNGLINDTALFETGLQAFHEYNPLRGELYGAVGGDGRMNNERKFYRYRAFGSDAALFVLDTRSFRDAPLTALAPSDYTNPFAVLAFLAQTFTAGRTLLGSQQLQDLKTDLLNAQQKGITWKFIAVPEPIQNLGPAGGEDRFEGYAAERSALLKYIVDNNITNVVFVTADVHGTVVNNLTYQTAVGGAQQSTGAFEVSTGSVAFDAPFGPTIVALATQANLLTPITQTIYLSLPVASDMDSITNDKDDFVKAYSNQILNSLGYDPVGLAGSPINATLLQGDYMAVHTFGWTEFEIAANDQSLTVTTYGIDAYTAEQLANEPAAITGRTPTIVSQFRVVPTGASAGTVYLPLVQR